MRAYLKAHADGVYLTLRLQPRASKTSIGPVLGSELKVSVTAPPVDSAANEALLRLLAERLNCPRRAVQLVRGQTSRHKVVFIRGVTPDDVERRLANESG